MFDTQLGIMINNIRKQRKMTLKELADATDLSVSYLSLLERGLNSPSMKNVFLICEKLKISFSDLLEKLEENSKIVIKKDERRLLSNENNVLMQSITDDTRGVKIVSSITNDNVEHISNSHINDEIGYVVEGNFEIKINNDIYSIEQGDTICIPANSSHSFKKTSNGVGEIVWIYAPRFE